MFLLELWIYEYVQYTTIIKNIITYQEYKDLKKDKKDLDKDKKDLNKDKTDLKKDANG